MNGMPNGKNPIPTSACKSMKKNCMKCHTEVEGSTLNYRGECPDCERKRRDDEDDSNKSMIHNIAMGDMLGTGIIGGTDLDVTTPW